jgi:hypothetical protein
VTKEGQKPGRIEPTDHPDAILNIAARTLFQGVDGLFDGSFLAAVHSSIRASPHLDNGKAFLCPFEQGRWDAIDTKNTIVGVCGCVRWQHEDQPWPVASSREGWEERNILADFHQCCCWERGLIALLSIGWRWFTHDAMRMLDMVCLQIRGSKSCCNDISCR